jgi:tetratricopeptide (TPR) repeat protein
MVERAVETAKAEADANPDNALHQYNYGSLLLESEDYDGAIERLGAAVVLDPTYVNALFNLGAAYQNKGVAVNDEVTVLDDKLRNEADELSNDERTALEEEMAKLAANRDSLFSLSVGPLETARTLTEEAGEDVTVICTALGQAYARTNQMEKATEAYACAEGKSLEEAMESEEAQPEEP